MQLDPGLTISGYINQHPGGDRPMTREWAAVLRNAGVPV